MANNDFPKRTRFLRNIHVHRVDIPANKCSNFRSYKQHSFRGSLHDDRLDPLAFDTQYLVHHAPKIRQVGDGLVYLNPVGEEEEDHIWFSKNYKTVSCTSEVVIGFSGLTVLTASPGLSWYPQSRLELCVCSFFFFCCRCCCCCPQVSILNIRTLLNASINI